MTQKTVGAACGLVTPPNPVAEIHGRVTLQVFADDTALATGVAAEWLAQLATVKDLTARLRVALSGGRIARQFFSAVAKQVGQGGGNLGGVDFYWGDERCVPPEDVESNFGVARELLFQPLGIAPECIHRIRGELSPAAAAREAEAELAGGSSRTAGGLPIFDWVFLGMGEDGHVASLFPGESAAAMASPAIYRSVVATKPPPHRITLGYATIAAAREVWVLASGRGKEGALRDSMATGGTTPLARVLSERTQTRIFTDVCGDFSAK